MVFGWLQSSAENYIALLCHVKLLLQMGQPASLLQQTMQGFEALKLGHVPTQGLSWGSSADLKRENRGITT